MIIPPGKDRSDLSTDKTLKQTNELDQKREKKLHISDRN